MISLKEECESSQFVSNHALKKITTRDDAKNDRNWLPYSYDEIKCYKCKNSTQYVKKLWFGFYDYYKLNQKELLCDNCST